MRVLAAIGALALLLAIGAAIFFFGGFYSIAGTAEDTAAVRWSAEKVRMASINRHATVRAPEGLVSAENLQAGARAFMRLGCFNCHGAPGVEWGKFAEGMRPDPPDLKDVAPARSPEQIFWVVRNGIKMTGMPSFALAGAKDEDIWKVAAFVKNLPQVSEADFKRWTGPDNTDAGEAASKP